MHPDASCYLDDGYATANVGGAGSILSADPPGAGPRRREVNLMLYICSLLRAVLQCGAKLLFAKRDRYSGKEGEEQEHRKKKRKQ